MIEFKGRTYIDMNINSSIRTAAVKPSDTLLHTLRELGLTGAKPSCENGDCGACTVLIDGWPIKSCLMLAVETVGHSITTVEGLKDTPVQRAFVENWAFQCGYCTSGFLMVAHALAKIHPDANENVVSQWLESNICRCTGYEEISSAVRTILSPNFPAQ